MIVALPNAGTATFCNVFDVVAILLLYLLAFLTLITIHID